MPTPTTQKKDPYTELIRDYLAGKSKVTMAELMENALELGAAKRTLEEQIRVRRCLSKLGWTRVREKFTAATHYIPPESGTLHQTIRNRPSLVRILFRGTVIDAQSRDGGIIDLVARAEKQHRGLIGRVRQYIAHALYRAGDVLQPGDNDRFPRVVERMVIRHADENTLPDPGDEHFVQRFPSRLPNGDRSYDTFVLYEGVEHKEQGFLSPHHFSGHANNEFVSLRGLHERADDFHIAP